jgi:hypothetical protein
MKKWWFWLLLILTFFLIGCLTEKQVEQVKIEAEENLSAEINDSLDSEANDSLIIEEEDLILDAESKPKPEIKSCIPGWRCKGRYYRGFQDSACNWVKKIRCDYQCENAECVPEPKVSEEEADVVEDEKENKKDFSELNVGDENLIEINGEKLNLKILLLEEDRVRLTLGRQRSDWLEQGDNYTFSSGIMITVKEILFQPYEGGVKAIIYEIG